MCRDKSLTILTIFQKLITVFVMSLFILSIMSSLYVESINEIVANADAIAKSLIGVKYTLWTGDHEKTDDKPEPFYINNIPDNEYIKKHGINCAGLINIMRLNSCGNVPGNGNWRGGIESWYNYLKSKEVLKPFDFKQNYPKGTLLLRNYRDSYDQGHAAVICDKHDIWLNDNIIHAYNDVSGGKVGITKLGCSHYIIPEGYYEYAILSEDWLY